MIKFRRHKNRLSQIDPACPEPACGEPVESVDRACPEPACGEPVESVDRAQRLAGDRTRNIDPPPVRDGSPRILILSASCGAGHVRAAEAVQLALAQTCPNAVLANVDVMDFTNSAFRRFYSRTYFDLVDIAPHLIGFLYDKTDRPSTWPALDRMRNSVQKMNLHRLVKLIVGGRWDLAISTHFLPVEIIASLRRAGKVALPQATVTTDFDTHHMWFNDPCELFFTASEEARANLAACRVPPANIRVTGIPIHPVFAEPKSVTECRLRHGLSLDRPVVLQLAGGLGMAAVKQAHGSILDMRLPLHVVTVAGRNARAREQVEAIPCPPMHRRTVLGFTREIDELMAAADVIVSKPGGLTSSEALARGTPMVIVDPIPGQESRNSDYLLENGSAIKANNLASLGFKLTQFLTEPGRLAAARAAAARLGKPRAAFDVAAHLLRLLPSRTPVQPAKRTARRATRLDRVKRRLLRHV